MEKPLLCIVIPCYNEQEVLPKTAPLFLGQLESMAREGLIDEASRIMFVNDGFSSEPSEPWDESDIYEMAYFRSPDEKIDGLSNKSPKIACVL